MEPNDTSVSNPSQALIESASDSTIAQLIGQVYESAPPAERSRLLEYLLQPLGVLSLVAVANGIFASIRLRNGGPEIHVQPEDAQNIQVSDVITLANRLQQVSLHAVDGLVHMLATSPMMTSSAATAVLMTVLLNRNPSRRANDRVVVDSSATAR
jgi:hypothetical protein